MADPTPPDPELIARCWYMANEQRMTQRAIAAELGISQPTVARYVGLGRTAEAWIDLLDRAEQRTDMAHRLSLYARKLLDMLDPNKGIEPPTIAESVTIVATLLKVEAQLAALLGLNAPTRVAVANEQQDRTPDAQVMAAVRRMQTSNDADVQALRAGRPGSIEGMT